MSFADTLVVGGIATLAVGLGMWSVPLMLVVVGPLIALVGIGLHRLPQPKPAAADGAES